MRLSPHSFPVLAAILLSAAVAPADNRPAPMAPALVPGNAPRSEFIDEVGFGKDPFFPNSDRHPQKVVRSVQPDVPRPTVPDFLALKGISVTPKLAIINTYTVAEGEDFSLRYGTQVIKVKCVEIKERSVVISVNNTTKELVLRSNFQ